LINRICYPVNYNSSTAAHIKQTRDTAKGLTVKKIKNYSVISLKQHLKYWGILGILFILASSGI
jgi:thiosulfate reductase cytochrome b subunit